MYALISARPWAGWRNLPGVLLTRGTADLQSRKLIAAEVSLTVPLDSQTLGLSLLIRDSVLCPWKQATAPLALEEEWNLTSHLHVTGVMHMVQICHHVTEKP